MDQMKNNQIAYAELLNRCWEDPSYLAKFREDPAACLSDFGIETVPGARYHVVAPDDMKPNTDEDIYLPYTENPETRELSFEELDDAAGGGFVWKTSNIVVRTNVVADTQGAVETLAAAVTVSVAAAVG